MVPAAVTSNRCVAAVLAVLVLFVMAGMGWATVRAEEPGPANRLFVRAMQTIDKADSTFDVDEESRFLREAERLLNEIVTKYPDSPIAVQLVTSQFVGDFDFLEFKGRIKALVCNEPLSSACFLHRIGELLPPIEMPVVSARWDWLSLAVAYHQTGDTAWAKEIAAPFVNAVRRGASSSLSDEDLFVARALSLMGQFPLALEITRSINDCSTRVYNLTDISRAALWSGDKLMATLLAEEAATFATENRCAWEAGLVVQALHRVGKEPEARTIFLNTIETQFSRFREEKATCCAPELAVAAAELGDPNLALNILRVVQDENPWTVPAVLGRLGRRGEMPLALAYAEDTRDPDLRGESLVELIDAALARKERKSAEDLYKRFSALVDAQQGRRPGLLAQRAKALKLLHGDERWRQPFLAAINASERASNFVRRDIGAPLLAVLVRILTGYPMLD